MHMWRSLLAVTLRVRAVRRCAKVIAVMVANTVPKTTALEARAATNDFLLDHLPHCFTAGHPTFNPAAQGWRVPVLLAYATIGAIGEVGEALVSATSEEIVSVTSFEEMNARAHSLYEEHRVEIETSLP
jgi:hypothetical protein